VVGLGIDPTNEVLLAGLGVVRAGRAERAKRMAAALEARGIPGSLEGACAFAANERIISRSHFARFLVAQGYARDARSVFKKYLVKGKPGYVSHRWADMEAAVGWIRASGGIAVIAHPGRYPLKERGMHALLGEFREMGGAAIEVVSGSHTPQQFAMFAEYASSYGLLASRGSDYHGPGESFVELGRLPDLPARCTPVWHDWPELLFQPSAGVRAEAVESRVGEDRL
jgi:predicted metal-dependent phosphoesterase TrpH